MTKMSYFDQGVFTDTIVCLTDTMLKCSYIVNLVLECMLSSMNKVSILLEAIPVGLVSCNRSANVFSSAGINLIQVDRFLLTLVLAIQECSHYMCDALSQDATNVATFQRTDNLATRQRY